MEEVNQTPTETEQTEQTESPEQTDQTNTEDQTVQEPGDQVNQETPGPSGQQEQNPVPNQDGPLKVFVEGTSTSVPFETPSGVITVKNEITLGDIVVSLSIGALIVVQALKWFISDIWRK